jgi:hypothetical protein
VGGAPPRAPGPNVNKPPANRAAQAPAWSQHSAFNHRPSGRHLIKRCRDGKIYVCIVQLIFRAPLKLLVWGTCSTPRVGEIRRGESGAAAAGFQCARAPAFATGSAAAIYKTCIPTHRGSGSLSTSLLTRCGPRPVGSLYL